MDTSKQLIVEENAGALHRKRRALLRSRIDLAKHERADIREVLCALTVVTLHLGTAMLLAPRLPWYALAVVAYTLGALLAHMSFLGMHECSHDIMCDTLAANRMMLWIIQIPLVIPVGSQFRKFHMLHHARQASNFDPDEPSEFEEKWFLSTTLGRAVWASTQYIWYLFRPLLMTHIKVPWQWEDTACVAHQLCVLAGIVAASHYMYGADGYAAALGKTFGYLALSIMSAMGPSIFSAHFLTEHRRSSVEPFPMKPLTLTTVDGGATQLPEVPTYCYYGFWNYFSYFVGYHCEHHDFPSVPGFRLPALNKELRFAYDNRPHAPDYLAGWLEFIVRPYINVRESQGERFTNADSAVRAVATAEWSKTTLTHAVDAMDHSTATGPAAKEDEDPAATRVSPTSLDEEPVQPASPASPTKRSIRARKHA